MELRVYTPENPYNPEKWFKELQKAGYEDAVAQIIVKVVNDIRSNEFNLEVYYRQFKEINFPEHKTKVTMDVWKEVNEFYKNTHPQKPKSVLEKFISSFKS
jgi:hypothetical protein